MKRPIVFLFSGQGSHYRGMGKDLFNNDPIFQRSLQKSEVLLRTALGASLLEELYHKNGVFDNLDITHPAIVAIEIAMLNVMRARNIKPDLVIGTSLGEFASAIAAGIWDEDEALDAAVNQARHIRETGITGGMISVLCQHTQELSEEMKDCNVSLASNNILNHFTVPAGTAVLTNSNSF